MAGVIVVGGLIGTLTVSAQAAPLVAGPAAGQYHVHSLHPGTDIGWSLDVVLAGTASNGASAHAYSCAQVIDDASGRPPGIAHCDSLTTVGLGDLPSSFVIDNAAVSFPVDGHGGLIGLPITGFPGAAVWTINGSVVLGSGASPLSCGGAAVTQNFGSFYPDVIYNLVGVCALGAPSTVP